MAFDHKELEVLIPDGWQWLIRNDYSTSRYFCNIYNPTATIIFPAYGNTLEEAITESLSLLHLWRKESGFPDQTGEK